MPDDLGERLRRDLDYRVGSLAALLAKTQALLTAARHHDDAWQLIAAGLLRQVNSAVHDLRAVTAATGVYHTSQVGQVGLALSSLAAAAGMDETDLHELAGEFLPARHPDCRDLIWGSPSDKRRWQISTSGRSPVTLPNIAGIVHVVSSSQGWTRWFVDQLAAQADQSAMIVLDPAPLGPIADFAHTVGSKLEVALRFTPGERPWRWLVAFDGCMDDAVAAQVEQMVRANEHQALFITTASVTEGPFAARRGDVLIELDPAREVGVMKTYREVSSEGGGGLTLAEAEAFNLVRPAKKDTYA